MGWTSVSYTVTRNNAVVQGLIDGKCYFFRIAAENIIGMGPFIEIDKMVLIKDPICKSDTCDIHIQSVRCVCMEYFPSPKHQTPRLPFPVLLFII